MIPTVSNPPSAGVAGGAAPLPAGLERAVRLAWVPPHYRSLFTHLPDRITLTAALPADPWAIPLLGRQLLKIALTGSQIEPGEIAGGAEAPRFVLARGERRCAVTATEMALDLRAFTQLLLGALFDPADLTHLLETLAFGSSNLSTLQRITNHMLQSTDVDQALLAMLCGITAGSGLAFNRAALFVRDEEEGRFVGARAVGPADAEDAHRIWEDIELHDKGLDAVIAGLPAAVPDSRYQELVRSVRLAPGDAPEDEVAAALASDRPLLCRGRPPRSEGLVRLGVAEEFVLAAVRPHGRVLGLIVADNLFSHSGITPEQLGFFGFFIDQTALVWENLSLLERVDRLARIDGLTGVLNRREFEARFEEERSRVSRSQSTCSMMLIDIDHFKETNDREGHEAGDEVLRLLGRLLKRALRGHDLIGRYGGDEFVVFLPDTSKEQLVATAGRLGGLALGAGVSLSIGGAVWPGDCDEPGRLKGVADGNLYRAKRAGRGHACFDGVSPVEFTPQVE